MQKAQSNEYIIDSKTEGKRLDKAVSELESNMSRARLKKLIDEEKITINRRNPKSIIQSKNGR